MTSASNQQITRCPKCGTAFRITQAQLQSAKGAVRCGSCLHVFKALDYLIAPLISPTPAPRQSAPGPAQPVKIQASIESRPITSKSNIAHSSAPKPNPTVTSKVPTNTQTQSVAPTDKPEQLTILSSIKPLPVTPPSPSLAPAKATLDTGKQKPVVRVLDKSSLSQEEDVLISDDMEETTAKSYEFDGFMDMDATAKTEVSLFERKPRDPLSNKQEQQGADESWAEMLIEDEDEGTQTFAVQQRRPAEESIPDQGQNYNFIAEHSPEAQKIAVEQRAPASVSPPGLVFSLIADSDAPESAKSPDETEPLGSTNTNRPEDEFILSDELASIPDHTGFKQPTNTPEENPLDPNIFETPDNTAGDESGKRQVKTQPKIRAYDGSRAALLMNIIPAPIEFTAKRMRRWYQRKLWPTLSLLALAGLVLQLGWFKFDYLSRVEPYRTAYLFLCPYLNCQVPPLLDTSQISAFNLIVREHPETSGALAVDVMIMNNAPFDQPYPDLVLVFTDMDNNEVASRRFPPKEYLGGEAAGSSHMPQKQPVHLTLDLVDPGEKAVNYHIYIPRH